MAHYSLPLFDEIDLDDLEEYYDAEMEFEGKTISVDLNLGESVEVSRLDRVKEFLGSLAEYDRKNKAYIEEDFNNDEGDTVRTYVTHHLENIPEDEMADLLQSDNKMSSPEIQLMKQIRLIGVGFYPDESDQFAVFDYSLGEELTNYLVVININDKGKMDGMTMES